MQQQKFHYIDTLRGLAILLVILVHQAQPFVHLSGGARFLAAYGQLGVQLFFVASAFTLCNSMTGRSEESATRNFYIRRFFRIAPLYYAAIALYFILFVVQTKFFPQTGTNGFEYSIKSIFSNATFTHGFSQSYYNNVVPGGWSIGTEMIFYVIFPVLFVVCKNLFERAGMCSLWMAAAGTFLINLAYQWQVGLIDNNNFFYCLILNQLPVFMIGFATYFGFQSGRVKPRMWRDIPAFLALTVCCYVLLALGHPLLFAVLPAVAGLSYFFLANIAIGTIKREGLIEKIGKHSYSMYVLHFVFAWFATRVALRLFPWLNEISDLAYVAAFCATVALCYAGAHITKALIEDPGTAAGKALITALNRKAAVAE